MYNNYVQNHISTLLNKCNNKDTSKSEKYEIMRTHLPYLIKIDQDTNIAKPINRDYKPLGVYNTGNAVDYSTVTLYDINTSELEFESCPSEIYLFKDGSTPWSSKTNFEIYKNKLAKLYKLENV